MKQFALGPRDGGAHDLAVAGRGRPMPSGVIACAVPA